MTQLTPEQALLTRLLVIEKMIKDKSYKDCLVLIQKLRSDREQFSNVSLANKISKNILVLENKIGPMANLKDKTILANAWQDLDDEIKKLIAIFNENGIN